MKKKFWIILLSVVVGGAILAAAGAGGAMLYLKNRNAGWLRDALAAYDAGHWESAKGFLERYIPQDPKNADLLLKYADACSHITNDRSGCLLAAATAYQQILTHHPGNEEVRHKLIDLYIKLSAWSTLRYYSGEWLVAAPEDEFVRYYHAIALDRMGLQDEALAAYEVLVEAQTDRSDVYGSYARLLREKGLDAKAITVFEQARLARPIDGHLVVDQARFLARESTWPEVQHLLDEGLAMAPEDFDVLIAVAQAAMLRRQHPRAVELLKKAIEVKPEEGPAYLMLASAYTYQGLMEEAIRELKDVDHTVQVDSPMILITLADLQLGVTAFDDAKKTITQYNDAYPDQMPVNEYFAAKELLVRGEPSAAVKRLASVVELRPGFALAQYTLAEAYLASGEPELARSALDAYLAKNNGDERAQRLMAQRFGRPMSIESLALRIEELMAGKQIDSQRLTLVSAALLDSAVRNDAVLEHAELLERTLARALEADPTATAPYRILADLALWRNDAASANGIIDDAIAQGCAEDDFAMLRAGVALARNDSDALNAVLEKATASRAFDHTVYAQWAGYFAQHDNYGAAMAMFERGIAKLEESEARATLEVERAIMALRHGEAVKAAEWIDGVDARVGAGTTLRRRFNVARLLLAQSYLVSSTDPNAEQNAMKHVAAVRAEDPGNPMLQVIDGHLLLRKQPPGLDDAHVLFERAVAADASNLGAHWGLARVALSKADYPRALMYIERALGLAPNVPTLQLLQADALLKTDRLFEAERVTRRMLASRPDDPAAQQMLVSVLLRRGNGDGAAEALRRLEELAVNDASYSEAILMFRGALLVKEGKSEEAEEALRAEVEARPENIEAICNLASVVMKQGRASEAKAMLAQFAEQRSNDPEVWVAIAEWWDRSPADERLKEASTALTRALLADPDYVPAIRSMLGIRLQQRDTLEALGICNRYLLRNPDDADMLNTKAQLLSQWNSRLKEALASADRAIELDDRADFKGTRGVILVGLRQYDRALRDLRPVALVNEDLDARVEAAMAEAYFATNDLPSARRYLDAAMTKASSGEPVDEERLRQLHRALQQKEAAA
ncbi:MAG: tetratricopeptide repeat protein [Candidatus Hydrogenedentes bacterium]|nr:tetratricopeptide repeat protein [Candidatus Hydrogenedentota bacterium]